MFSDFLVSSGHVMMYMICQNWYEVRDHRHLHRGPSPRKNCLRGGLNSEKVITSVVLNEFLINLQYRKVCGE